MSRLFPTLFFNAALLAASVAFGHETTATKADIALEEKLGQYLPVDAAFIDENGRKILLGTFIDKPTIIAPVYLGCTHECPLLLTGLAQVLGRLELVKPGRDFQVMAISFDDTDTPKTAAEKKVNYLKAVGKPFPEDSWKFVTGDAANIKKFTDSIGFKFQRDGEHSFSHPVTLVVVSPAGKIVRYLEGISFLPFDVTMALSEAAQGKTGSPARKALMYCFSYDPLKKSYVFNILKVTGTVMVLFVASFFAYLMISTKKKRGAA
ncbi:MAG TPA: SCO family protein [Nitrospirota bacterium]|nr:SCO family protein [Nitrospirota bacterium]